MAVLFKIVRRPRTRKTPDVIRRELRSSYAALARRIKAGYDAELADTRLGSDVVKVRVRVTGRSYSVTVAIDRRTRGGKIFWWLDQGTGLEGPNKSTYVIEPVNVPMLKFTIPYKPATMPPGPLRYDPSAELQFVSSYHIDHPGIQARHISDRVLKKFKDRKYTGGFYRTTENAYRRGFRRWMRTGG